MDKEVAKLETEINILKERVSILEKKERRRTIFKYIKILLIIVVLTVIALGLYKGYEYVTNSVPNFFEEIINNLKSGKKS